MTRPIALVAVAFLAAAPSCSGGKFKTTTVAVNEHRITVEIANTGELRAQGLMYRDSLPANGGMIFVYPEEAPRSFWMRNTRIPLSIAFADKTGRILNIEEMKPMQNTSTPSRGPAMYALEMNEGWFAEKGVKPGDTLSELPEPPKP
jgi:uncharacterized membrane protein (UPF0127 family)